MIDDFLSKPNILTRIEIVCPRAYHDIRLNKLTKKVTDHLRESDAILQVLVLTNGWTKGVFDLIGITEKKTKVERLQIDGVGRFVHDAGISFSELKQLSCSADTLFLLSGNRKILQLYVRVHHSTQLNAIVKFLGQNTDLKQFIIEYDDQPIILSYDADRKLLKTSNIEMIHRLHFNYEYSELHVTNLPSKHLNKLLTVLARMKDKIRSLYVKGQRKTMESIFRFINTKNMTIVAIQADRDKIIINKMKNSVELHVYTDFVLALIPKNVRRAKINYYAIENSELKVLLADTIMNCEELRKISINTDNGFLAIWLERFAPNSFLLKLFILNLCIEAAPALYEKSDLLALSSLQKIFFWDWRHNPKDPLLGTISKTGQAYVMNIKDFVLLKALPSNVQMLRIYWDVVDKESDVSPLFNLIELHTLHIVRKWNIIHIPCFDDNEGIFVKLFNDLLRRLSSKLDPKSDWPQLRMLQTDFFEKDQFYKYANICSLLGLKWIIIDFTEKQQIAAKLYLTDIKSISLASMWTFKINANQIVGERIDENS